MVFLNRVFSVRPAAQTGFKRTSERLQQTSNARIPYSGQQGHTFLRNDHSHRRLRPLVSTPKKLAPGFAESRRTVVAVAAQTSATESQGTNPYAGIKAFVAGATGGTGRKIVEELVAKGIPVRALVRDKSKASDLLVDGVEVVEGDVYQYMTLPKALGDCNVVFCATGSREPLDPLGPFTVDYNGTVNLVNVAARAGKVKHFVFVTSIGTDDILFPLNLFWGVLFWKKRAEEALQRSGLTYTIVRPGGLKNEPEDGSGKGNVIMKGPNSFGLPPREQPGSILREQVAEVCVAALIEEEAANKIVEVISKESADEQSMSDLFAGV
ncbi:hypothetical protein CYMTET_53703 [Cymbomonas tetramitiformis]|uniref:NAD(P)-binding domain-containing protein n=1 Tax=Cymbomonas tetramitiformis TaxID=36881 RepID=A0AAE0EPT0_9CHLO|nr:hypothetical protein CYMTET_53703 [Cymbomonas tetramitiformis]